MTVIYRVYGLAPDASDHCDLGRAMWTAGRIYRENHPAGDEPLLVWRPQISERGLRFFLDVDGWASGVRIDEVRELDPPIDPFKVIVVAGGAR